MEKLYKYKTLETAMRQTVFCELTLEDILSGFIYLKGRGWRRWAIPEPERARFIRGAAGALWKNPTANQIDRMLTKGRGAWFAKKLIFNGQFFRYMSTESGDEMARVKYYINK